MKNEQQFSLLATSEAANTNGGGLLGGGLIGNGLDLSHLLQIAYLSNIVQGVLGTLHRIFK